MTRIRDQFLVRRDATRIAALRDRAAEGPTPFVSIVIVSRDGAEHLRVLLPTLGRAAYPRFEVIVVDNGSTDATEELLAARWPFDLRAVRNEENRSFSEANNQALAIAGGQFVLFLNNDVLPVGEHWLGWMVAAATSNSRPSAVGALLLHPPAPGGGRTIRVQHAGIRFGFRDGHPHPRNQGGDDGTARKLATRFEVPAVTAAALLAAREDLEEVGGFPDGYWYGAEDVDLCLSLRARGPIVLEGMAAMYHAESSTQKKRPRAEVDAYRRSNWELFRQRWTPRLRRSVLCDRLTSSGFWSDATGPEVSVLGTLPDAALVWLESGGWKPVVGMDPGRAAFGLTGDPRVDLDGWTVPFAVAWVSGSVGQWADVLDVTRFVAALVDGRQGLPIPEIQVGDDRGSTPERMMELIYRPRIIIEGGSRELVDLGRNLRSSGAVVAMGSESRQDRATFDLTITGDGAILGLSGSGIIGQTLPAGAVADAGPGLVDEIWSVLERMDADCDGRTFGRDRD